MKIHGAESFLKIAENWLPFLRHGDVEEVRQKLLEHINMLHFQAYSTTDSTLHDLDMVTIRDCARTWRGILHSRSEQLAGHSVLEAMINAARGNVDTCYSDAFWTDICHLVDGIEGGFRMHDITSFRFQTLEDMHGREAALHRSEELDLLHEYMDSNIKRYISGLDEKVIDMRSKNRKRIISALKAGRKEWNDWKWHLRYIARDEQSLSRMTNLTDIEKTNLNRVSKTSIPFGVTPYYASLFDSSSSGDNDRVVRAQVLFPGSYIDAFGERDDNDYVSDFMLETDTSPVDLITRRYANIVILKPFNSCPQICVYCQRNWEIKGPMAPGSMADRESLRTAIRWIKEHKSITEVLVTGGDPLAMSDNRLKEILDELCRCDHIERIRIGTRTPVTLPMRFTPALCTLLASYRIPGKREICLVTHVEHPYELTPDVVVAVERLRRQGIPVYNQLVYTFFVSRRFEAVALRRLLRLCGIDPYYTFYPKGKNETEDYRVPIARLLQEQKEESRLMPGMARTDEPVYNVPGLGKNHLNAWQHRDLVSIDPDGARVYEFHPWEKKIADQRTYVGRDVPILNYLRRLETIGENPDDYGSIWYYF